MCILKKNSKEEENIMAFSTVLYKNIDWNGPICSKMSMKTPLKSIRPKWKNMNELNYSGSN